MLIVPEIFAESMRQRRCVVTQARLGPNELVASRSRMPSLYGGRPIADEVKILDYLLQCAHAVLVCDMLERSHVDTIRRFFLTIIDNSQLRSERCLHLYLYHFWDQLWRLDSEGIHLTEKFYEGMSNSQSSRFAERLLPRLCDQEARTDIVGFDELGRKLYLVEVKQGELDDRAIGQILRYYSHARTQCDRVRHDLDIRSVVPVIIVESARMQFWEAVPFYFREFLEIFFYTVDNEKGKIWLRDGKKALRTSGRSARVAV